MSKMTGEDLVKFCRSKIGTAYVYGMKGRVMSQKDYATLRKKYGSKCVWDSDAEKIGKVCVDCSGLISWACGVVLGSSQWMTRANEKHPISTLKDAPIGALVWMKGHIGVYSGMKNNIPYYIAADGSAFGVREVPISYNEFTHWLLVESVFNYKEGEMVTKETLIYDGKEYSVDMIRKDGVTYIKTRDLGDVLGLKVSSKGKIPVLEK